MRLWALASLITPILGALYSYDAIDCSGNHTIHYAKEGCIDLTNAISNRLEGNDRGWKFYPTKDCSGNIFYLIHPDLQETLRQRDGCIVDNLNYPFIAQSARSAHPRS